MRLRGWPRPVPQPPRGSDAEESTRDHQAGTDRDRPQRLPHRRSRGIQPQHAEADGGGQQAPERPAGALATAMAAPSAWPARSRRPSSCSPRSRSIGWPIPARSPRRRAHSCATICSSPAPRHSAWAGPRRCRWSKPEAGDNRFNDPEWSAQPLLRLLEAGLSHHHALARPGAGRDRGSRRAHAPARRVLPQAAGKRAVALQLPHDQPRRAARDAGLERPQPRARHGQPHARSGEVGRRPQHQPDRRGGLRGRPQHRHLARQGRVPERADPAHPVRAEHRQRARDAAADRAALDQQVLHPRPRAAEVVHPLHGRQGLHGVRGVLGQPRRAPQGQDLRGVHDRRACWPPPMPSSARPASSRSTSSATASAARCSAPRWPTSPPAARSRSPRPPSSPPRSTSPRPATCCCSSTTPSSRRWRR